MLTTTAAHPVSTILICSALGALLGWAIYLFLGKQGKEPSNADKEDYDKSQKPPLATHNDLELKSYESCRELLVGNIKIMEKNEIYIITAISALMAFGVIHPEPVLFYVQALLVPLIAFIGMLRWFGLRHVIHIADDFCRYLEKDIPGRGWSSFYNVHNKGWLGKSRETLWAALCGISVAYALACLLAGPFVKPNTNSAAVPAHSTNL